MCSDCLCRLCAPLRLLGSNEEERLGLWRAPELNRQVVHCLAPHRSLPDAPRPRLRIGP